MISVFFVEVPPRCANSQLEFEQATVCLFKCAAASMLRKKQARSNKGGCADELLVALLPPVDAMSCFLACLRVYVCVYISSHSEIQHVFACVRACVCEILFF